MEYTASRICNVKLNIHVGEQDIKLSSNEHGIMFLFTDTTGSTLELSDIGICELFSIMKARTDRMAHSSDIYKGRKKSNINI